MYDLLIIGGGINGCGIARDAAGRGLSVLLAEQSDLGSGTSSASTKLIHGGLRYLEHYDFRLVHEALRERDVLMRMAPHCVEPLRFMLPYHAGLRPAFLIRLGLFLYDHLGGRRALPRSEAVDLTKEPVGAPLKPEFVRGFAYSDCSVDDARLVVLNAMDAAARGADIRVRTKVVSAHRAPDRWHVTLQSTQGHRKSVRARAVINAAGAWAGRAAIVCSSQASPRIRLVRGSHIVVDRMFDHPSAYIFQNADRRVVFAIPYQDDYTLIGTTDVDFAGSLEGLEITSAEVSYLCAAVNAYFRKQIAPSDVVWSYTGVRSLYDDGKAAAQDTTRDFALQLDGATSEPPLLTLIGGKITTFRHVAEEALKLLAPTFPHARGPWTRLAPLPGGDLGGQQLPAIIRELAQTYRFMDMHVLARLVRAYGTIARDILKDAKRPVDLGVHFGAGLYEREVVHLLEREWAVTADDILWRRTKLGLRLSQQEREHLSAWLTAQPPAATATRTLM